MFLEKNCQKLWRKLLHLISSETSKKKIGIKVKTLAYAFDINAHIQPVLTLCLMWFFQCRKCSFRCSCRVPQMYFHLSTFFVRYPESKTILIPLCMGQLRHHLGVKQEMNLCANILADILSSIQTGQSTVSVCSYLSAGVCLDSFLVKHISCI